MTSPSLSVTVTNYNQAKFVSACLEAILKQSVRAQEIIVIDDCSTDNSVDVIQEIARKYPEIKFHCNEVNRGALYTINRALEMATGEFVCLCAADDEILPGCFEHSLRILAEYPQAGLSCGICRFVNLDRGLSYYLGLGVAEKPSYFSPREMEERIREGRLLVFTATQMARRRVLIEAGKFIGDLRWHCDWFAFFVAGFRHGICFVPEVIGEFRVLSSSYSQQGMRKWKTQVPVLRRILEKLDEPQYQDVAPFFRTSAILAPFGKEMLWLLLTNTRYWKYLNFAYRSQKSVTARLRPTVFQTGGLQ
jgi:glycosyltransferase involved in cell wall biosynthesis